MKKFDWDYARDKTKNPMKLQWLFDNHRKDVSEEEFVKAISEFRQYSVTTGKSKKYCPSALRIQYRSLVKDFGFFNSNNW